MKRLILRVGAVLLAIGGTPLSSGVAQGYFAEGAITDYFIYPDCAALDCHSADPGITDCCTYWVSG